jgi:hypothetical protein
MLLVGWYYSGGIGQDWLIWAVPAQKAASAISGRIAERFLLH